MVGKGAAQSYADTIIRDLVDRVQIPVLSTSMGRGVLPDNHPLSVIAARSLALAKADVVLIMGARYAASPLTPKSQGLLRGKCVVAFLQAFSGADCFNEF